MLKHLLSVKIVSMIAIVLLAPLLVFGKTIALGGLNVEYDEKVLADTDHNGKNDRTSYYLRGNLVLTAYDDDGDGKDDYWFTYNNNYAIDRELSDANKDGVPDKAISFDENEKPTIIQSENQTEKSKTTYFIIGFAAIILLAGWLFLRKKKHNTIS